MSDFDIFPELEQPEAKAPSAVATAPAAAPVTTIRGAVLAQFKATEPVLRTLVARYADVAIDCSTPKGLTAAKEARHDMRENGRFVVQRAEKAIKDEVNGLKNIIASEAERLVAIVQPTEKIYDDAIKAREAELGAEKAEREAKEAARVSAHRANLSKLASYATQAQGRTSDDIVKVINGVAAIEIDPAAWEEFAAGAEAQKAETLDALQALFDRTKTAEDEAAARETQRIENERAAAALAEERRVLAEQKAELDRQLAEIAAAKKADADRAAAAEADDVARIWEAARRIQGPRTGYVLKAQGYFESGAGTHFADDKRPGIVAALRDARAEMQAAMRFAQEREAKDAAEGLKRAEANARAQEAAAALLEQAESVAVDLSQDPEEVSDDALAAKPEISESIPAVAAPAAADMDEVAEKSWVLPAGPVTFAERQAPAADEPATLNLTAINDRFGGVLSVTAAGLALLGIEPAAQVKASKLFKESQFIALCDALVDRIGSACAAAA